MSRAATPDSILVVRLGAMGDVIHALPAVASLKRSFPDARISWMIERRWSVLLEGNPCIDEIIAIDKCGWRAALECYRALRGRHFTLVIDFQGLLKSAIPAALHDAGRTTGFAAPREKSAALFYSERIEPRGVHVVDQNLSLSRALGARTAVIEFRLPVGAPEGELPEHFVLASPFAGWGAKEWPLARYGELATLLHPVPLVLNGPPSQRQTLAGVAQIRVHVSSVSGLIDATRRAAAVVGVDSGPLHLAAALGKQGVALFGPTDPARNGPYGAAFTVLRSPRAVTTYRRRRAGVSMQDITAAQVFAALKDRLT
jgi:heptosyltransferase-1